jgi:hypothetical protein
MTLAEITTDITNLAPGLTTVDNVAKAVSAVAGVVTPLITQSIQDKTKNELAARLQNEQEIFSLPDSVNRAIRIGNYATGLCVDGGYPTGELSGNVINVPVEVLQALCRIAATEIAKDEQLYGIIETLKSSSK